MIQSLTVKNFLSFRDKATFSFEASNDKSYEDHHVVEVVKGVRLLKLGIVYGYNASGKSNLIEAFQFLIKFWFAIRENKDINTGTTPFLLDRPSRKNPSEFKLVFYRNEKKYIYTLVVESNIVRNEKLEYYPGTQPAIIFNRIFDKKNKISKIETKGNFKLSKNAEEEITLKCLKNMSVFAALSQVNIYIEGLNEVSDWLSEHIYNSITPNKIVQHFTLNLIKDNLEYKNQVLDCLKEADFNITGIDIEEIIQPVTENFINQAQMIGNLVGVPNVELERLKREKNTKFLKTELQHAVINKENKTEIHSLPIESQSEGTKRVLGLFGAIINTIKGNAFLAIDEIESKLHPRLIEYVIEQFLRKSETAQLLLTTHYDNLFDEEDLLRKDNFWFTEKGEDGTTNLYPLSGFNGLNRISSLQKAYKYGKFGAIPNMD
jgi:AAA15 family ATPase/GTPase